MESIASYSELNISEEGVCDHIENNASLNLYVKGLKLYACIKIDPTRWYCTTCNDHFRDRIEMEQHAFANL